MRRFKTLNGQIIQTTDAKDIYSVVGTEGQTLNLGANIDGGPFYPNPRLLNGNQIVEEVFGHATHTHTDSDLLLLLEGV